VPPIGAALLALFMDPLLGLLMDPLLGLVMVPPLGLLMEPLLGPLMAAPLPAAAGAIVAVVGMPAAEGAWPAPFAS
jgi:hypothetical protein